MPGALRLFSLKALAPLLAPLVVLFGCSASSAPTRPGESKSSSPTRAAPTAPAAQRPSAPLFQLPQLTTPRQETTPRIKLGIDVLEADGFASVKGKKIGLLTHPAGVNGRGVSTVEVLRKAPGVQLVALYAVEHGLNNQLGDSTYFQDAVDPKTGLMVYSLYNGKGRNFRPRPEQLKPIDALVIDLQDVGTRSYTFSGAMKSAMEICFENGKEVIILDRPNPLGGLKVGGPPLDADLMTDVGRFRVPYVHGLTMGELAQMSLILQAPGGLAITDAQRAKAKLTIIAMKGWTRSMRWPETGLPFVPTSTRVRDFSAVQGYPMTGLGTMGMIRGFSHGVGAQYEFRGVSHPRIANDVLEKELRALNLPGHQFRRISAPNARTNQPAIGVFVEINDYDDWQPCDLNFWLMKLAARAAAPKNPFATFTDADRRTFLIHVGSRAFYDDLVAKGANVDINAWLKQWREQARIYQEQSKKFWLYR